jgi:hypothetical protein
MADGKPLNEGQCIKVPFVSVVEKAAHIKVPAPMPQSQPTQAPAQPSQSQSGGTSNAEK